MDFLCLQIFEKATLCGTGERLDSRFIGNDNLFSD